MHKNIYLLSPSIYEGVNSLPMIAFKGLATELNLNSCDTLLFTSKHAVRFAHSIESRSMNFPAIAIGTATKKELEKLGANVIYTAKEFYAESLAKDIVKQFSDKKILYLRPKVVSFDSRGFLEKEGIFLEEQIIYERYCKKYTHFEEPEDDSIIIFTSPSTVECFFENFNWKETYRAVAIGHVTMKHLPSNVNCVVADEPLISSCIKKAKEF